ncbi:unnamed protein product [Ixodes pacificus]
MGQKVCAHGFRVGPTLIKGWDSVLYAEKHYKTLFIQDLKIRDLINKGFNQAQISRVLIERPSNKSIIININAKKPNIIIGRNGSEIDKLKKAIEKMTSLKEVYINIHEVRKFNIDAAIVAQTIALQIEKRVSFRKAMKTAIQASFKQGGQGIRVNCSGRLGGAEIARTEWYIEGRMPLHTLRADIDYSTAEAITTYGVIGVKVWIYKAPKKQKFRKAHKGRVASKAKAGTTLAFGSFGLKSIDGWRVTARQIEAGRKAATRCMKRQGRLWIRIFPDVPVSKKPAEVRMGKGKGSPEFFAVRVSPGRIIFEIEGVEENVALRALELASAKLPVRTRIVRRYE